MIIHQLFTFGMYLTIPAGVIWGIVLTVKPKAGTRDSDRYRS